MRIRNAVVIIIIALISAITFSITGQEEALPVVRANGSESSAAEPAAEPASSWRAEPALYLAVEPIHELAPATLAQAARNNDYVTFHELYVRAQNRGEDVSQYQSLHELWSWAIADPIGAFYGRDIYESLARAYPGYRSYIDEFRLIDRRGNVFYPTAETREFLLDRALRGDVPRVMIAEAVEDPTKPLPKVRARQEAASVAATVPASEPVRRPATVRAEKSKPATETAAVPQKASVPSPVPETLAPPVTIFATPQAPIVAEQPKIEQPVATQPATTQPIVSQPSVTQPALAEPVIPEPSNDMRNRGILLLIIGLLGTGILAVILRAPREQPRPLVDISDKVHAIRKQATPPHGDEPRASGLHG